VEIDSLGNGLKQMEARISKAAMGAGSGASALRELGLSAQALKELAPDQAFTQIAEAMSKVENQSDKVRLSMDLFGKSGTDLIPIMNGGAKSINELRNELNELNGVVDSQAAKSLAGLGDQWDRLTIAVEGAGRQLLTFFAPVLDAIIRSITKLVSWIGKLGKALRYLQTKVAIGMVRTSELFGDTEAAAADALVEKLNKGWDEVANGASDSSDFVKQFTENAKKGAAAAAKISAAMKPVAMKTTSDTAFEPITLDTSPIKDDLDMIKDTSLETAQILKDSFKDALSGVGEDFNSVADIATNAYNRIRQNMTGKAADIIGDKLFSAGEGLLNGALQDAFRPSKGAIGPVNVPSLNDFFGGFFADGGHFAGGKPIIVGERGPEMIMPRGSGTVIPNEALAGRSVNITMNIHTPDASIAPVHGVLCIMKRLSPHRWVKAASGNHKARLRQKPAWRCSGQAEIYDLRSYKESSIL
jgi:hypothetical protein